MPRKLFAQTSFFSPEFADPGCLEEGSVGWVLRSYPEMIFPAWLFGYWSGAGRRGRKAWPASVLATAMILASREGGMSRRAMTRRLRRDTSWRAACGLEIGGESPDEATFRRFERYLQARDPASGVSRVLLLHEHIVRLCVGNGVVAQQAKWAMDSTPMWCFGAVQGTFRLLGDGLRSLCRQWARLTGQTIEQLAQDWELPLLLAKSTKAHFRIDWHDAEQRAASTDALAEAVLRTVERIRRRLGEVRWNKRKGLLRLCRSLLKVLRDELETDEKGRLVVAHRVARDRLVSITDPQARSSRKSKSQVYKGFKVHVLGDLLSGLIASVSVTPANVGDGWVGLRLVRRARQLCAELTQVLGDTAYGGAELHVVARDCDGVEVLAPPQPIKRTSELFGLHDFAIDTKTGSASCPAGVTVQLGRSRKNRFFRWTKATCSACLLREKCVSSRVVSKTLVLHPYHEEVQKLRARWDNEEFRERYRTRSQVERLVNECVRRGCRRARAWGVRAALMQAHVAALGTNLALLAKTLAADGACARAA